MVWTLYDKVGVCNYRLVGCLVDLGVVSMGLGGVKGGGGGGTGGGIGHSLINDAC